MLFLWATGLTKTAKRGNLFAFPQPEIAMDLSQNNVIRFRNVSRKKDSIFANFQVKGIRKGVFFTANISVDIAAAEMHPGESLETIIERCADIGLKEFQSAEFCFEGLVAI